MEENCTHGKVAYIRSNGVDLAYEVFGKETSSPLLLIMGLSSQMIMWEDEFCERFADKGYMVIRFDNRDVGLSTKLKGARIPDFQNLLMGRFNEDTAVPYTLEDMADDTIGLLDGLGIHSSHVVGASMGGMIAQEIAIHYPGRLRTITSIMSSTGNPLLPPPKPEALEFLFKPIPRSRDEYIEYFVSTWILLSGPYYPMDEKTSRMLAEESFRRGFSPAGSARQIAAILAARNRKEDLKSLRVPALVIHGDEDPLVPVECGLDTAQAIPGAKLKIIKGMGHALPKALWGEIIGAIIEHARE